MEKISGLEAIRLAVLNCCVKLATYVPGYPITSVAEALDAELCVNEKVALEMALGASTTGVRAMVMAKQVGMNVLADPLVISATHTIGSGLVILAGDDLGPRGSQAEMDSRYFGSLAEVPVLDPGDPAALYSSIREAFLLSERLRIPAIVRITERLINSQGSAFPSAPLESSGQAFDRGAWDLTALSRHQRHHSEVLPLAEQASEATTLNRIQILGSVGIVASGYPATLARELRASLLCVGYAYPLPWRLVRNFVNGHRLILVAEEPEPVIELQLRISPNVRGKLTGHLPFGPLERSDLAKGLENLAQDIRIGPQAYESAAWRGYASICQDCPFISLYKALGRMNVFVAGDAGCAILAAREPFGSVDVVFGLGSAIGVASGFKEKGIAVMGDFAFAHTGLLALVNAVWQRRDVLVVLVQNGVAAMTGGQEAPDLTKLVETLVPTRRLELPALEDKIEKALRQELARPGASAVIAFGKCTKYKG